MHFYFCMSTASEYIRKRQHRRSKITVYCHLMHFVQGQINHSGYKSADAHRTHQVAHQISYRGVFAE